MSTGVFNSNSNSAGTPAVSATGTNGAKGVNATSDSGHRRLRRGDRHRPRRCKYGGAPPNGYGYSGYVSDTVVYTGTNGPPWWVGQCASSLRGNA